VSYFSEDRMAELRQIFFESAQELLQVLNEEALKLEKTPGDAECARSIRRTIHTLKGDSAACGFRELSELAHELEDALVPEIAAAAPAQVAELVLAAADFFDSMLAAYRANLQLPTSDALRTKVRKLGLLPDKTGAAKDQGCKAEWSAEDEQRFQRSSQSNRKMFRIVGTVDPKCDMPSAARQLFSNVLQQCGEVLGLRSPAEAPGSVTKLEAIVASDKAEDWVKAHCVVPHIISAVEIELWQPVTAAQKSSKAESTNVQPKSPSARPDPDKVLRVDAARLDQVLNLIGELVIGRSMMQQLLPDFKTRFPKDTLRNRFADIVAYQSRVLNDLQRSAMQVRMVPVEQLFRRFPRLVRDVSQRCGKEVTLLMVGQDTEVDKSILDGLAEPLAHVIRNAVDHGIETAADRASNGKAPNGTLRLSAYHQGNQVVIEVCDDGRGLDSAKILAKAVERGLVQENSGISEAEIFQLIFRPGFSTADKVTEISGRGVGLDVVQDVLHRMKGSVTVDSNPASGTKFQLRVPLTLAIIKALLFWVDAKLYAVPLSAVLEIARVKEQEIHQVDNYEILQLRESVLTIVRLGQHHNSENSGDAKVFVVVIQLGDRKYGLIVDELTGEEELVIKPLNDRLVATDLVSGASIMGDGTVVLILNLASLVQRHAKVSRVRAGQMVSNLLGRGTEVASGNSGFTGGAA